jgi:hypothetical protein
MKKYAFAILCIFIIQFTRAQSPCNVQTRYGGDGVAIKYAPPETIDSTADFKTAIGLEFNGNYNYVKIILTFKSAVKKVTGDLVIQFTDFTSIIVPLTNCVTTIIQGTTVTTCNYIVLDKYISALKTKQAMLVAFNLTDKSNKPIDMKLHSLALKNAITCLNP